MYKRITILSIIIKVVLTSCSSTENLLYNPDTLTLLEFNVPKDSIKGDEIKKEIYTLHEMECINDILVILSDKPNAFISVIDCKNDSIIAQFGNLGHAKDEFIDSPKSMYWEKDANGNITLYCQDLIKSVTKVINLTESIKRNKCILIKEIKHDSQGIDFQYFHLDKEGKSNICRKFVTFDDPRDNIYYPPSFFIKNETNSIQTIELYPKIISNDLVGVLYSAYFDILHLSPDKTKLVQAFNCIDLFNVINISTHSVNGYMGLDSYDFESFQELKTIEEANEKMHLFYQDVCVTDSLIIALKDGRNIVAQKEGKVHQFKTYVIDWNGNILSSYFMDRELAQIAYNENLNVLYGIDLDGNLFKYNLDKNQ